MQRIEGSEPAMQPWLIPGVMEVDRATKWALCDGTNSGRCREAEPFLKHEERIPPLEESVYPHDVAKGLRRF